MEGDEDNSEIISAKLEEGISINSKEIFRQCLNRSTIC